MVRLSHSQVSTTRTCGYQHVLQKKHKVPERPHWGTIAGTAFHEMAEKELLLEHGVDAGEVPEVEDALDEAMFKALENGPYGPEHIRTSRTTPKGYSKADVPNGQDREFFIKAIPVWIEQYRSWRQSIPYHLWFVPDEGLLTPNGAPAVEVELRTTLGGQPWLGFVDAIFEHNLTGELLLVDTKTGQMAQKTTMQLGTYRVALLDEFPDLADRTITGAFYDARKGASLETYDLSEWTRERLDWEYHIASEIIEQGLLAPNYESCEFMCSVRDFCAYRSGMYSNEVPLPWPTVGEN